jgi:D-alanine transaminase
MSAIDLQAPAMGEVRSRVVDTYRRSELPDAQIYLEITRGVAQRTHAFPVAAKPTFLITVRNIQSPPLEDRQYGVRIITVPETRWARCDIKSVNLLPNILAKQQAKSAGVFEAVFVGSDGLVTEGSSTNLFAVTSGRLLTREEGPHILSGITRRIVLDIASDLKMPVREGPFSLDDLLRADEVFLTGTTTEVMPVVAVNNVFAASAGRTAGLKAGRLAGLCGKNTDVTIGKGVPGPVSRALYGAFRRRIAER